MLLLLLLLIMANASWWRPSWVPPIYDTDCTFTRNDVLIAMKQYVDVNPKDNRISPQEVQEALDKYLPTIWKPLIWGSSVEQVFDSCDADKNGFITSKDFRDSAKRCFPNKEGWCTVQWFRDRIVASQTKKKTYVPLWERINQAL